MKKELGKAEVLYEDVVRATSEEVRQGEINELKGHQEFTCHIIFDENIHYTRKARYVSRKDMTGTPVGLCYSNGMCRDSVRISFLIAALNDLDILAYGTYH